MSVLRLTESTYRHLQAALLENEDKESAAILLCRETLGGNVYLGHTVMSARTISNSAQHVTWSGAVLRDAQDAAEDEGFTIFLSHSHPSGALESSSIDDESDRTVIPLIFDGWLGKEGPQRHGSLIMTPEGQIRARLYDKFGNGKALARVSILGNTIRFFDLNRTQSERYSSPPRAFGSDMTDLLGRVSISIIGISGTGSVVAEQLIRLGVGHLRLVDFDRVEPKNLNRILNSTANDAKNGTLKSELLAKAGRRFGSLTKIESVPTSILDRETILACATSDLVFSCVDSLDAREMCDSLTAAFLLPLIDVGVTILTRADEKGERQISDVLGRVDYVRPEGPSLLDRGVYSAESLRQEYLRRNAPEIYSTELAEGYIKGIADEAPPVIAVNMKAASTAVLELIGRLCPFRHDSNDDYSRTILRMAEGEEEHVEERAIESSVHPLLKRGDLEPLLNMPILSASS